MKVEANFHGNINLTSDPEQIKQVLWNIFLNAVEAMPDKGILQVNTEAVKKNEILGSDKEMVRITVRDTGEGFTEKALSNIFAPFFTTKEGGSGLGLAIVKRIVEGLKGSVYGENHPGGGAVITVLIEK